MKNVRLVRETLLETKNPKLECIFDEIVSFHNDPTIEQIEGVIGRVIGSSGLSIKPIMAVCTAIRYAFPDSLKKIVVASNTLLSNTDPRRRGPYFDVGLMIALFRMGSPIFPSDTMSDDDREYDTFFIPFIIAAFKEGLWSSSSWSLDDDVKGELANAVAAYAFADRPGRRDNLKRIITELNKLKESGRFATEPCRTIATELVYKRFRQLRLSEQLALLS